MSKQLLVGTWKLVSSEYRDGNGNIYYPLGKDTKLLGYVIYNADGYMSATLMFPNRLKFASADVKGGTTEEKVVAFDTYISYCGTYELQQDTVIHHIELSSNPNWVGVDQIRMFSIESDRLSLSTPPILVGGVEQTGHYIWERVKGS